MIGDIIGWLIVGLIVGALARLIMPGRDPMGCLMTALLGIAGSVVGGLIGRLIGWGARDNRGYFTPSRN
ncbi:MAG TPA: GlsB/YeaQ/YmgE family stress response membrane protein, partial [Blastocatellia bacterium]|nr:GlsB/YeaQ/YmgE family stress response membrane protein [Blastocatellia bacterium]